MCSSGCKFLVTPSPHFDFTADFIYSLETFQEATMTSALALETVDE